MHARFATLGIAAVVALAIASLVPVSLAGQAPARTAKASIPRTADGHPDLQGIFDAATITPLERPTALGTRRTLTDQEVAEAERGTLQRIDRAARPSDPNRVAPPIGGDGSPGASGLVGGYNNFWIDSGTLVAVVNGERRSSLIIDPPNGRVPPLTAEAQQRNAARAAALVRPTSDAPEQLNGEGPSAYDDPERRPLAERCLIAFGSSSGPPALPVLYNNFKQIVVTKDHVMILNEMVHDVRIIPIDKPHAPTEVRKWLGDSAAHWEGNTLVIDTTNFSDKTRFRGSTESLRVVERITRQDANNLIYRFTVDDPSTWTQPWTAEYNWRATNDHLYEYACHEANYALGNILRGYRSLEAAHTKQRSQP